MALVVKKEKALDLRVGKMKFAVCSFAAAFFAAASLAAPEVKPVEWENVDPAHHLG